MISCLTDHDITRHSSQMGVGGGVHSYCKCFFKSGTVCVICMAHASVCVGERFSVQVDCGCAATTDWHDKFQTYQTSHPLFVTILYLLAYLLSSLTGKSLRQFIDLTVGVLSYPGRQYLLTFSILVPFNSSFPISFIEIPLLPLGSLEI